MSLLEKLFGTKDSNEKPAGFGNNIEGNTKSLTNIASGSVIKILGSGCDKCNQLEKAVKIALEQLDSHSAIEHVTDFSQIASYGVLSTPALVVDEKVIAYGKVLKPAEIIKLLQTTKS